MTTATKNVKPCKVCALPQSIQEQLEQLNVKVAATLSLKLGYHVGQPALLAHRQEEGRQPLTGGRKPSEWDFGNKKYEHGVASSVKFDEKTGIPLEVNTVSQTNDHDKAWADVAAKLNIELPDGYFARCVEAKFDPAAWVRYGTHADFSTETKSCDIDSDGKIVPGSEKFTEVRKVGPMPATTIQVWRLRFVIMRTVEATLEAEDGVLWTVKVPEPVKVTIAATRQLPKRQNTEMQQAVIFPDKQLGYWWDAETEEWRTTHDEAAIDVSLQIMQDIQAAHDINRVIDLGDLYDFPQFSKHRSAPSHLTNQAMNKTLKRGTEIMAEESAIARNALLEWIEGNHDLRLRNMLMDKNIPMVGIFPGGDETKPPIMSLEAITCAPDYGWEIVGPYPEGTVWLNHRTRALHGTHVGKTSGITNDRYLQEPVNTIYGHTHRAGCNYHTWAKSAGPVAGQTFFAISSGCLCRMDGAVPSAKGGINDKGQPGMSRGETWQQGFLLLHFDPEGKKPEVLEPININDGWAMWRGKEYFARCDADGRTL